MHRNGAFYVIILLSLIGVMNAGEKLKVYILAGQSNMQGYGYISKGKDGDLDYAAKNGFEYLKDNSGKWAEREDVWFFHKHPKAGTKNCNLKVGLGANTGSVGPELAFGHIIGNHHKEQVLLIKCAWGGQPIGGSFRPPSSGPMADGSSPEYMGVKYRAVISETKEVLGNIKKYFPAYKGQGYEIMGFFWHQGWNDGCNRQFTQEYEVNMVNFVKDMRKDLELPNLPFIIATSGMGGKGGNVYNAQVAAAAKVDNCYAIDTIRFRGHKVGRQISHWYNSAESYCKIGRAGAQAMISVVGGQAPSKEIVGDLSNKGSSKKKKK